MKSRKSDDKRVILGYCKIVEIEFLSQADRLNEGKAEEAEEVVEAICDDVPVPDISTVRQMTREVCQSEERPGDRESQFRSPECILPLGPRNKRRFSRTGSTRRPL